VAESLKFYGFGVLWFGFLSFIPVLETTEKEDFFQKKSSKRSSSEDLVLRGSAGFD